MSERVTFFVAGVPKPGGSKRAFVVAGKARLADASGQKGNDWRGDVKARALEACAHLCPFDCPLSLRVTFIMPRPKSHYGTGRNSQVRKESAPHWHTSKPDATKLLRSLEDACTGIVWRDDSCIAVQEVEKVYGDRPGAEVTVRTLEPTP